MNFKRNSTDLQLVTVQFKSWKTSHKLTFNSDFHHKNSDDQFMLTKEIALEIFLFSKTITMIFKTYVHP